MKKYMLFLAFACLGLQAVAQLPLPCVRYANGLDLQGFNGQMEVNCLTIDLGQNSYTIADDNYRGFEVDYATIEPGSNGENTGIQILPGADPNSGFQISLRAAGGGNDELAGAWFEPSDSYEVPLYEKAEWGMILPAAIETAIDNWIYNDENPGSNLTPALNPFDPDQIDLWAEITIGGVTKRLNGFFYIPFERNTNNPDKDYWDWDELPNDYRFRFRYSPETMGFHFITVHCNVTGYGQWEHVPFVFNATWNDPRKSFVSVSSNKHFFQTVDGQVIIPIGINHNDLSYSCECYEGNNQSNLADCNLCYFLGSSDPCCGLSDYYCMRRTNGNPNGTFRLGSEIKEVSLPLAGYIKRDLQIQELKNKGATGIRIWTDPFVCDIEFEKLTNYYERQYQAWEFDNCIEKCHEVGLRIEWCQMMHYMLCQNSDGASRWDWGNTNNCGDINPNDQGCCYFQEFGNESAIDFLTDANAKMAYKKKLRYMIARWGYSSDIFLIDLISEVNNIGDGERWDCIDEDNDGSFEDWTPHFNDNLNQQVDYPEPSYGVELERPYSEDAEIVRPAIYEWHVEMARFIKEDLMHTHHLISADYTGHAPMSTSDNNPCDDLNRDLSWQSSYIDVMALSYYNQASTRYESIAENGFNEYQCGTIDGYDEYGNPNWVNSPSKFRELTKPTVFAECGGAHELECDHTNFIKDMLVGPLSGHATAGMSWSQLRTYTHWYIMSDVDDFLETFVLNTHDIGTENWHPGHEFSSDGGSLDNNMNNGNNDQRVEVAFYSKESADDPKIFGVILNRTWNAFSVTNCSTGEVEIHPSLQTVAEVGWSNERLKIPAVAANYTIRYFDPNDLTKINEVINSAADGSLELEDYPLMFDGTSNHKPYYFFVAFKEGSEWDAMPTLESSLENSAQSERVVNQTLVNPTIIHNNSKIEAISLYPNPSATMVTIVSAHNAPYKIFNSLGQIVLQGNIGQGNNDIDIQNLTTGSYLFFLETSNEKITFVVQR